MMIGSNIEYIQANTEIKCLLKYFPISYIKKLPTELLEMIHKNSDEKYNIDIDIKKDLNSQKISKKTKDMLAVLTYNYWSSENEKKAIVELLNKNEKRYQEKLREKYNPDNLFRNKNIENSSSIEETPNNVTMIEYKESIFIKIKNWFKKFLNK